MMAAPPVLLTTCHIENDGTDDLFRLVTSVSAALQAGEIAQLRHIVLLQGCNPAARGEVAARLPGWVELLSTDGRLSSPAARNMMIRHLVESADFRADAFVGFPDDDAWYPPGALACVAQHFSGAPELQLLICRYGPEPSADQCSNASPISLGRALLRGACAAIFVRAGLLAELGGFHELLGLGTPIAGGEDTEFVHRAFQRANGHAMCIPGVLVGHAASDPEKKLKYYEGGLAAVMAHSHTSMAARKALLRKLAVGTWLVIRQRMTVSAYIGAVRKARAHLPSLRAGISATSE